MDAIVLLSGGLDSTTCATLAVREFGPQNVLALSIGYGQKHVIESKHAEQVANRLGIEFEHVKLEPLIFRGAGSTLVDEDRDTPDTTYDQLQLSQGVSPTYVPFRNGNFLSVAAALALTRGASMIYYGAHAEDGRNWAYPDCTPEFNGAIASAIYVGTYHKVRLATPLQWLDKAGVVKLALEVGAPLDLTYSCYKGKELSCGTCPTCVSRLEAFRKCGVEDPIPYVTR